MNPMQTKLEQAYKEYLEYKQYTEREAKPKDDLRTLVAERVIAGEDNLDVMFEIFGEKQLEQIDLNLLGITLSNYYQAYKDLTEIPAEIKEKAEKLQLKYLFAVKNGKRETVDKDLYKIYKEQFIQANQKE